MRSTWRIVVVCLLLGLNLFGALGCAHLELGGAYHDADVAALMTTVDDDTSITSRHDAALDGIVDLSEPPTIVEPAPATTIADYGFSPGTLLAATEAASWLAADRSDAGAVSSFELRNACGADLSYAFAAGGTAGDADAPRRTIEGHTIQTQHVPTGHWLHLWDGDRWLGAAVATTPTGELEIASTCDTLEVRFELPDRGPTSFAIHWELEIDDDAAASLVDAAAWTVNDRVDAGLERWGEGDRVGLRLVNACVEPVDYVFSWDPQAEPEQSSTIPGHAERRVEVPADWWLRYQTLDDTWRGGAATNFAGAVVWIAGNCVDFGVADGEVVGLGGS